MRSSLTSLLRAVKTFFGSASTNSKTEEEQQLSALTKAAERGDAKAQLKLGLMCANGDGVSKNAVEALAWYRRAADQGNGNAYFFIGLMYENGEGVLKDVGQAVYWYTKAAERGDVHAKNMLGLMCEIGEGVPKSLVQAYKWYSLAAAEGDEIGNTNRDIIEQQMTPDQIAEGQRLSTAWEPKT